MIKKLVNNIIKENNIYFNNIIITDNKSIITIGFLTFLLGLVVGVLA